MNIHPNPTGDRGRPLRRAFATPVAAAVALLTATASAQDSDGGLQEVVVTAQFRESDLQKTPIAISVLSGDALAERNLGNVIDIEKTAPNVTINQLGSGYGPTMAASIRGMSSNDFKAVYEPAVPIYVDDVLLARPTAASLDLLDLERVEVLRGPQGTLFGANALGGVIRLVTRKPTGDGPSSLEIVGGSYNRLDIRGGFETTLVQDRLFARVSGSAKRRDGYVDVIDFTCDMRARGTPQRAGIGDGIVGWNTATNTPILGAVGSQADNLFAIPQTTSPNGTDRGCKIGEMGDEDVKSGRATFRFVASEALEFMLNGDVTHQNNSSPADFLLSTSNVGLVQGSNRFVSNANFGVPYDNRFVPSDPFVSYASFKDPVGVIFDSTQTPGSTQRQGLRTSIDTPNVNDFTHWGLSGVVDWRVSDSIAAKAIVAYRTWDAFFGRDSDGSPLPLNHTLDTVRSDQVTAELRLSGRLGPTEWTVGAFHLDLDDFNSNISVLHYGTGTSADIDRLDIQNRSNLGFFVHTVSQLTERFMLTAGVRWSRDEKDIVQLRPSRDAVFAGPYEACNLVAGTLVFPCTPISEESDRVTPSVTGTFQWTPELMTYLSYSRGYRGGGFNPRPNSVSTVSAFGPEDLDSFELGMKSGLFDDRLRLNLAGFFMIYKDLQVQAVIQEPGNPLAVFNTTNAGEAHIKGVEAEFDASLGAGFSLQGSAGWLDFSYEDLGSADPAVVAARGFNPINQPCRSCTAIRSPEYTGSLGVAWTGSLANGATLQARADLTYQSEVFYTANNFARASQGGYTVVDARVTWNAPSDDWSVAVFGTNLTDKLYRVGVLDFVDSLGSLETSYGRPREYGVSIKRRF